MREAWSKLEAGTKAKLAPGQTAHALELVIAAHEELRAEGRCKVLRAVAAYRRAHLLFRLTSSGDRGRLSEIEGLLTEASEFDEEGVLGPWPQIYRVPALHALGRREAADEAGGMAINELAGWQDRRTRFLGAPDDRPDLIWRARVQGEAYSLLEMLGYMLGLPHDQLFSGAGRGQRDLPDPTSLSGRRSWCVLDTAEENVTDLPRDIAVVMFRERQAAVRDEDGDALLYAVVGGRRRGWVASARGEPRHFRHSGLRLLAEVQLGDAPDLVAQQRRFRTGRVDDGRGAFKMAKHAVHEDFRGLLDLDGFSPFASTPRGGIVRLAPGLRLVGLVDVTAARLARPRGDPDRQRPADERYLGWLPLS